MPIPIPKGPCNRQAYKGAGISLVVGSPPVVHHRIPRTQAPVEAEIAHELTGKIRELAGKIRELQKVLHEIEVKLDVERRYEEQMRCKPHGKRPRERYDSDDDVDEDDTLGGAFHGNTVPHQ